MISAPTERCSMELEYSKLDNGVHLLKLSGRLDIIGTGEIETKFCRLLRGREGPRAGRSLWRRFPGIHWHPAAGGERQGPGGPRRPHDPSCIRGRTWQECWRSPAFRQSSRCMTTSSWRWRCSGFIRQARAPRHLRRTGGVSQPPELGMSLPGGCRRSRRQTAVRPPVCLPGKISWGRAAREQTAC